MLIPAERNLDFLAARLHGWRSRLAEGAQLDELCRIRTVAELVRRVMPGAAFRQAVPFQRQLIQAGADELARLADGIGGAGGACLAWQRVRFQIENLKVLARGFMNQLALEAVTPHLVELPGELALDLAPLTGVPGGEPLTRLLSIVPEGPLREGVREAGIDGREKAPVFRIETALDHTYLETLLQLASAMGGEDGAGVVRLARQEVDIFNQMLVVRGWRHYHLSQDVLRPAFVVGGNLSWDLFEKMLGAEDSQAGSRMLASLLYPKHPLAAEASVLEALGWNRYLRLANALFRQSHMSLGVVIGFAAIRRIELANLITLSEGMRMGLDPRQLRLRLIPRAVREVAHV
jgi:vacuolar-type H+-ATPase subunit C/Vma6